MGLLSQFFQWVDADVARYWLLAWTSLAVTALVSVAPACSWLRGPASPPTGRAGRWLAHPGVYVAAVLLTFAAFRWPVWFFHGMGNPDEAQLISGAITLRDSPVFWKSVDGTTFGPLIFFAPLLPAALGLELDYLGARVLGTALHALALLGVWAAARRWLSDPAARLGVLPGVILLGTTSFGEFVQYNSEMVPLALLGLAAAAVASGLAAPPQWGRGWLFTASLLLGAVPFAKLQAGPIAGLMALLLIITLGRRWWREPIPPILFQLLWLIGGGLLPTALVALHLFIFGLGPQFWQSYIVSNLSYASDGNFSWSWIRDQWYPFLGTVSGFTGTFTGQLVVFVLSGGLVFFGDRRTRPMLLAGWMVLGVTFLAVMAPGRIFPHYLQFMVPPLAFLLAVHLQGLRDFLQKYLPAGPAGFLRWIVLGAVIVATAGPAVLGRKQEPMAFTGAFSRHFTEPWRKPVSHVIRTQARPGERLTVWGWMPGFYVETGLPQGTRDGHTQRMITEWPMRGFYRDRFLRDFRRNRPAWFVDAVGGDNFFFTDRAAAGHEIFAELEEMIRADYTLVADLEGSRIYRRNAP
jgi:hypothetical protein